MPTNGSAQTHHAVVTGGAGFLGSHLCDALVKAGNDVICIDNFETGTRGNLEQLLGNPLFHLVTGNINDGVTLSGPVDVVYHFAAPATPSDYLLDPVGTMRTTSRGTQNMLELAREQRSRFVLASTSDIYGSPGAGYTRENDTGNVDPVTAYGAYYECRRFSESLTASYRLSYDVRTAIARIFATYGPRMRLDDGRILSRFVRQALRGAPLTVPVSGSRTQSLCYVADVVSGIIALARGAYPGPVNLGSPAEMSVFSIARQVRQASGPHAELTYIDTPADDLRTRRPDIGVATELLGWQPRTTIADGLATTMAWFEEARTGRAGRLLAQRWPSRRSS